MIFAGKAKISPKPYYLTYLPWAKPMAE